MNIILIPRGASSGKNACFLPRHLLLIGFVGVVMLPALVSFVSFRIHDMLSRYDSGEDQLAIYAKQLSHQARAIDAAKHDAAINLNALTRRMGQLQAQVLRLNALGGRLTRMAGLDGREFSFDAEVAQGGPESISTDAGTEVSASLESLSNEIRASQAKLHALETLLLDRKLSEAVTPAGWPADGGFVSSGFGQRADPFTGQLSFHEGIDIAAKQGSSIHAVGDGVVSYIGEKSSYGNTVEITHASGLVTRYAHTLSVLVKVGDKVTRGQTIALVGSSGRSTGPHIHIEVVKEGRAVNPAGYLRASN